GQAEVAASSIDAQFAELETSGEAVEIEARLAALKQGSSPAPQVSPTQVTPAIESGTSTQAAPTSDWSPPTPHHPRTQHAVLARPDRRTGENRMLGRVVRGVRRGRGPRPGRGPPPRTPRRADARRRGGRPRARRTRRASPRCPRRRPRHTTPRGSRASS